MTLLLPVPAEQIEVAGAGYVALHARDLERTARFYARLFGFRVVEDRDAHVLLSARGNAFLALREHNDPGVSDGVRPKRCAFVVKDLERARETLWNQGVVPIGGCMAPTAASVRHRFLVIEDPDGRELELIEEAPPADDLRLRKPHELAIRTRRGSARRAAGGPAPLSGRRGFRAE